MLDRNATPLPFVSIVVLNYNGRDYLSMTLPPLFKLTYPSYEIIVVDNHSTDDSQEYLQALANNDSRLRLVINPVNYGYGRGKNIGVEQAKGEYILLLDEDIQIDAPNIITELLELYGQLPDPGFISLLLRETTDRDRIKLYGGFISLFSIYSNRPLPVEALTRRPYHLASSPDGGAIFFRKKMFIQLGGYDISQPYYLDVGDLGLRAAIYGYRTYVYNKRIFRHLGTLRKQNNKEGWIWKYGYHFSGLSRVMFKNYRLKNLIVAYPYFCLYSVIKMIFNLLRYKDLRVASRLVFSVRFFLRDLRLIWRERQRIQARRILPTDVFLHIHPPK